MTNNLAVLPRINTSMTHYKTSEQGIGLVEVLVALMLLAVAILGFSAMQMTAVKATDESLMRTRALTVIRGGAEMMRLNPTTIPKFAEAVNATTNSLTVDAASISKDSCVTTNSSTPNACTPNQLATRDGLMVRQHALDNDLNIALLTCPDTGSTTGQNIQCFVASWGTTAANLSDTAPAASTGKTVNCGTAKGTYNTGAQCFIMEAY